MLKSLGALRFCLPGVGFAGVEGEFLLVHPDSGAPGATNSEVSRHAADRRSADGWKAAPPSDVLTRFVEELQPALEAFDEYDRVSSEFRRIVQDDNGARRQRRAWRRRGEVPDVIAEAAAATLR